MKKLTKNHPSARWMIFFGLLPPTAQVQCGKNGGFDVSFWLYLFIYCYCVILLYTYISIQVLYCLSIVLSDILGILSLRELSFLQAPYYGQNNSCCGIPFFHRAFLLPVLDILAVCFRFTLFLTYILDECFSQILSLHTVFLQELVAAYCFMFQC